MCRIRPTQRFVLLFCTRLFLSLNDQSPAFAGAALSFQALYRLVVIAGLTSAILNSVNCWFSQQRLDRIRITGFGSGRILRFSFGTGSGVKNL